jgi:DNA (cytosine-5)-methyltransferase 1
MTNGNILAEKTMTPEVCSLFSGCGGMDLGFKLEGFKIVWANDNDHWACETYKKNFGDVIVEADIADIDLSKIPECDVMVGGFPCQDFSTISSIWDRKQPGLKTQRGNLYKYFAQAVLLKKPKVFLAENVKGLLTANEGQAIRTVVSDFERAGYPVSTGLYDFADYGVPQFRRRVLIVGIEKDMKQVFVPPAPSHGPHRKHPFVTSGEALKGVERVSANNEKLKMQKKTVEMLKLIKEGQNFASIPKDSEYYVNGYISHVYRRLDRNEPSYTIIAAGGGGTWGYHYEEPRALTNRERARLQTFPDDFIFCGGISDVRRQIGNGVPPEGIRPFARTIKSILSGAPRSAQSQLGAFVQA